MKEEEGGSMGMIEGCIHRFWWWRLETAFQNIERLRLLIMVSEDKEVREDAERWIREDLAPRMKRIMRRLGLPRFPL